MTAMSFALTRQLSSVDPTLRLAYDGLPEFET